MDAHRRPNLPRASAAAYRLNRIAGYFNCKTYLEIGVCCGNTFFHVNVPHKTAVDPWFRFQAETYAAPGLFFFEWTSNDFFARLPWIQQRHYGRHIAYDLIYIDGMHTFEQTILDFVNTIPVSHAGTIWVFDDTVPRDPYSALADNDRNQKYRLLAGLAPGPWHGDVYKCVFAIHDYFMEYSWCTQADAGNGQTIIWKTATPAKRRKLLPNMAAIRSMGYFDMLEKCHALNIVKDQDILQQIGRTFAAADANADKYLDMVIRPLVATSRVQTSQADQAKTGWAEGVRKSGFFQA